MKLDRVFLAFLKKDGEEHLLYKKDKDLYIDLNTKEKIKDEDIDLTTLILFKDSIHLFGDSKSKYGIKKEYKKDRESLIDIDKLCVVDVRKASKVESVRLDNVRVLRKWYAKTIYRTVLEDVFLGAKDIRNGKLFHNQEYYFLDENDIYVEMGKDSNIKYLRELYPSQKRMEKNKVLKLQYDIVNYKNKN